MTNGVGAALLILWGVLNAVGGALGARNHPEPWIAILFVAAGGLIVAGGIAVRLRRPWALLLSALALVALTVVTLASALLLRGPGAMRPAHHAVRAAISGAIFLIAWLGSKPDRVSEAAR